MAASAIDEDTLADWKESFDLYSKNEVVSYVPKPTCMQPGCFVATGANLVSFCSVGDLRHVMLTLGRDLTPRMTLALLATYELTDGL